MKIGLVTCEEEKNLYGEDCELLNSLIHKGHIAIPIVWNDKSIDFQNFDILIVRSVWDYHYKTIEFIAWLNWISSQNIKMYNSVEAIKFNIDKHYLETLSKQGVSILPSLFFKGTKNFDISPFYKHFDCNEIIIKPTISASAFNLLKISREEIFSKKNDIELVTKNDFIIQPFISEIYSVGEISLVFFNKNYSHSVRKLPKVGDFRVQDDYGGTYEYINADDWIIRYAEKIIQKLPFEQLLYSRIDSIVVEDRFYLMEVELIEPVLYIANNEYKLRFIEEIEKTQY